MCVKLSPCCDTVTPLAASDAISRNSFMILFVSAMFNRSRRVTARASVRIRARTDRGARRSVDARATRARADAPARAPAHRSR